ncbi:hypothetical protein [Actinomadura sp. 6N118]|uniref:hypothetical protein n=1 Tax=Actinomadura sp. 6N118 TaxID=3375151 RepID=UPI00379AA39C
MLISWRQGSGWSTVAYMDEDVGHVDLEDVLWWLLRRRAHLELIRPPLATAHPDFDPNADIDHITMPDHTERRVRNKQRRLAARAEFERTRHHR